MNDKNKQSSPLPMGEGPHPFPPLPLGEGPGVRGIRQAVNPYLQVFLTYPRHVYSKVKNFYIIFVFFFVFILTVGGKSNLILLFFLFYTLSYNLLIHIKEQSADIRSHIIPNFRRVHSITASVLVFLLIIAIPSILSLLKQLPSVGFVALIVFYFGVILWDITIKPGLIVGLIVFPSLLILADPSDNYVNKIINGQYEILAYSLLFIGLIATVLGGIRMFHLHEEMPISHKSIHNFLAAKEETANANQKEGIRDSSIPFYLATDRHIARLTYHAGRALHSWRSRICRWQLRMSVGWVLASLIIPLVLLLIFSLHKDQEPGFVIPFLFSNLIPVGYLCTYLPAYHRMSYELLLPVSRAAYFRQMGTVIALGQSLLWCTVNVLIVLWFFLCCGKPYPINIMMYLLLLSALYQIFLYGLQVWTARYRSLPFEIVVLIVLVVMIFFVVTYASMDTRPEESNSIPLWVAAVAAAFGLLLTVDAYFRWLETDID
jgi:hypothetical protein